MNPSATSGQQQVVSVSGSTHLRWRVVDGDLDGLAHGADVDHRQDVAVAHLQEETDGKLS